MDCGLLVGLPSVVKAPPSNAPIATKASTIAATHAPIVVHGFRALASAIRWSVVTFIAPIVGEPAVPRLVGRP
jgi:hypothetical protein